MQIDPRRLRFLLATARAGGVLAGADELRVTPSAVSQQLARLEQEVGRPVVRRTPTGVVLTDAGLALAEAAEEIERVLDAVQSTLSADEADPRGTVRLGGFQSFLALVVIPELPRWRARYPGLRVEVVEADADDLLRLLRAGELDIVILELDAETSARSLPARVTETPLLDEPWRLVVPSGTITSVETLDLSRLNLPWLGVDPTAAGAAALKRVRRAVGSSQAPVHTYLETRTALALVAAGEGMALVPSLALQAMSQDGVEALDVPGLGVRRIVLRRHEGRGVAASTDAVTRLVREAAATFSLEPAS